MRMRMLLVAMLSVAACGPMPDQGGGSSAASGNAGIESPEWNDRRVAAFDSICIATLPSFAGAVPAMRAAGFDREGIDREYPEGFANTLVTMEFEETGTLVSVQALDGGCSCFMSFASANHLDVLQRLIEVIGARYPGAFRTDGDPRNLGRLERDDWPEVSVQALANTNMAIDGHPFVGLFVLTGGRCAPVE